MKKSTNWARKIKIMNNLLPTLDIMNTRYPNIIKNPNCLSCNNKRETLDHVITCHALEETWDKVIQTSLSNVKSKIEKAWSVHVPTEHIKKVLTKDRTDTTTEGKYLRAITRGFIPESIRQMWKKTLKTPSKINSAFSVVCQS